MHPFVFRGLSARSIRLVAGALALLMALQGIATTAFSARGSLHTHSPVPTHAVLDDVRRWHAGPETALASAVLRHGHSHGGVEALRHPHATGDDSVTLAAGEAALHASDTDDAGYGGALGALIALVPSCVVWAPQGTRDALASQLAWLPQSHHPDPFERPPRST